MLIRSTRHACFVMLPNGLTLELFYDHRLAGERGEPQSELERELTASQGVWMFHEEVLVEVKAGQA